MVDDISFKEESEEEVKGFSIKEIILMHLRKISDLCCQEFTGGYWNRKPVKTQGGIMFTEVYHEDKREAYCNAVDFLIDILYPKGDSLFRTYIDTNEKNEYIQRDEAGQLIKRLLVRKRETFREINKMFERTNFWVSSDSSNE